MSIKEVLFAKNVNVEKIKRGSATEKKIPFFYPLSGSEDYSNLVLQTPIMYIPFSPQEKKSNDGTPFTGNITTSFRDIGSEKNIKKMKSFHKKIKEIENFIRKEIEEINPNLSKFYKGLRPSTNEKYSDLFQMKIMYKNGEPCVDAFDKDKESINFKEISNRMNASFLIRLDGVWIARDPNVMGIDWTVKQIMLSADNEETSTPIVKGFAFRDE
tara:strand:- start:155 stop:796 length:642 start_codon:yes stop_codon:yes gene_type:complete